MKDIAVNLPGGFSGMPAHLGAMHAWFSSGLQPPGYICTSSAGGIAGAITVQQHERLFVKAEELMINLR